MYSLLIVHVVVFFFFKQKTAYEMRISDWSSDVCSSDLRRPAPALGRRAHHRMAQPMSASRQRLGGVRRLRRSLAHHRFHQAHDTPYRKTRIMSRALTVILCAGPIVVVKRSEEHTSELQSLMRISYDVFCLKKKKKNTTNQ